MTGPPPSTRQAPADPAAHAADFSARYAEPQDYHTSQVMLDMGLPPEKIGASDPEHEIRNAAFHPHGRIGGDVTPDGRIVLDSGVMNPDLLTANYGEEAGKLWGGSRLRSRIQAIAAHEWTEYKTGSHAGALARAPNTELPLSHEAREILRAMRDGWKGPSHQGGSPEVPIPPR